VVIRDPWLVIREKRSLWRRFRVSATDLMESSSTGFSMWIFKFRNPKRTQTEVCATKKLARA
jgi:hypothetical protein